MPERPNTCHHHVIWELSGGDFWGIYEVSAFMGREDQQKRSENIGQSFVKIRFVAATNDGSICVYFSLCTLTSRIADTLHNIS